jgi:hypothetical protein
MFGYARCYSTESKQKIHAEIARSFWSESVGNVGLNAALGIQFLHFDEIDLQVSLKVRASYLQLHGQAR